MRRLTIRFKLYVLQGLYAFCDWLANITHANQLVVRKKLYLGATILSLTLTLSLCTPPTDKAHAKNNKKNNNGEASATCYLTVDNTRTPSTIDASNSPKKIKQQAPKIKTHVKDSSSEKPILLCYDVAESTDIIKIEEDTLSYAEQMPMFKGGLDSMNRFINRNLTYPPEMAEIDVIGRVILQFTITDKGNIANIKVLRSLHPLLDNEAVRVVKLMPKWIPGKQGGKERNVRYILPFMFQLN